jgi:hypothetical protein
MNTIRKGFRAALLMAGAVSVLAFAAGARAQDKKDNDDSHSSDHKSPVLAVVGDVSCQPGGEIELSSTASVNGTVLEPKGEAKSEFCFNPKTPYTPTSLWQSQEATANLIETMKPNAVALVGDLQYQVGQFLDFENSYDLTYGGFKKITRPAPGNHEFYDEHGELGVAGYGYFSYFNGYQITPPTPTMTGTASSGTLSGNPAVPVTALVPDPCPAPLPGITSGCGFPGVTTPNAQPIPHSDGQAGHFEQSGGLNSTLANPIGVGDGWYSYNLGAWHLISLNIECETSPNGCSDSSGTWLARETEWLKNDLEENHSVCTAAYWHQPTFAATDSLTPEGVAAGTWWQLLYDNGADLVLNGHDHLYARYAPLKPVFDPTYSPLSANGVNGVWTATPDPKKGIVEFIAGTGGETLDTIVTSGTTPTDPSGALAAFNAANLVTYTQNYWGVLFLTLDHDGYAWNFKSALELPGSAAGPFVDTGSAKCHGGPWGDNGRDNN